MDDGKSRGWRSYDDAVSTRTRAAGGDGAAARTTRTRRVVLLVLLAVVLVAGVLLGAVPGSSAVGRYPVWDLRALEDRIADGHGSPVGCGAPPEAHVDLLTGRVVVATDHLELPEDELVMVTFDGAPSVPGAAAITGSTESGTFLCL